MRILHVTDNFFPFVGGLERAVAALTRYWAAAGYEAFVVTARHPEAPDRETRDGVEIYRLPSLISRVPGALKEEGRTFLPTSLDPVFSTAFARAVDEIRPDVVHVHSWAFHSVVGVLHRRGIPVVTSAHDYGQVCAKKTLMRDAATPCPGPSLGRCLPCVTENYGMRGPLLLGGLVASSRSRRRVTRALAISTAVAAAGDAFFETDRRAMTLLPSFVADHVLELGRTVPRPAWTGSRPYVFYAGALAAHKGVPQLLDAHAALLAQGFDIDLVLAGIRHDEEGLTFDRPRVKVVESAPHEQIMGAWRFAEAGVVPSVWPEPLGQVAVECLAAGTPLVVSASGGLRDVSDRGRFGVEVQPGSVEDLVRGLSLALTDPQVRSHAREHGPARAAEFTLSSVAPRLAAMYQEIVFGNRDR